MTIQSAWSISAPRPAPAQMSPAWRWSTIRKKLFPLGNSPSCPHGMQNNIFASMTSARDLAGS